ncbi:hypothetical protein ABZ671_01090 [Micromonospora sp. NPDC006766]|uniref:hypothetical protein n=1 Tax=Micromonospora sp. NPDC006766 TaxID=3154778 RepID=UPI0033EC0F15
MADQTDADGAGHPDPAVEALAGNGWLDGTGLTVDNLAHMTEIIRAADLANGNTPPLRALAEWLVMLDEPAGPGALLRRTVTLNQIIVRARAALSVFTVPDNRMSPVDLSLLIGRHTPVEPGPCRVCGAEMTVGGMGGGSGTAYRCSVASADYYTAADRVAVEDHYRRSQQRITYHGDPETVAALHELRALRVAAGEDMAVPVGAYACPDGHGQHRCNFRLRHEGGDRWVRDRDSDYTHDPAHAELNPG